jgi:hypothetical protein
LISVISIIEISSSRYLKLAFFISQKFYLSEDSSFIPIIDLDSTLGIMTNFDSNTEEALNFESRIGGAFNFDSGIIGILDFKGLRIGDVSNFVSDFMVALNFETFVSEFEIISPSVSSISSGKESKLELESSSSLLMRSMTSRVEELI